MQFSDLALNTSAAIIVTTNIDDFPAQLAAAVAQKPHTNQHRLLVHNAERKSIPIDLIREIKQTVAFSVGVKERQEIVFLWAELLTLPAQHALLKLLEEPPPRIRLWLVTDQPQSLLETIQSRCVRLVMADQHTTTKASDEYPTDVGLSKALREIDLNDISSATYSKLINFAGIPKDRTEAANWCDHLLRLCRLNSATKTYKLQQALILALERLQQNGNVKLVLEECLFQMKASI